jgi:hypothetical protein
MTKFSMKFAAGDGRVDASPELWRVHARGNLGEKFDAQNGTIWQGLATGAFEF